MNENTEKDLINVFENSITEEDLNLSDELVEKLLEKANELISEMVPIALENDNINLEDINEFNINRDNNTCYQGIVYPPVYNWSEYVDDFEDIANSNEITNYVEIYYAFMEDGATCQDTDRVFAVILFKIDEIDSDNGRAFIEWMPVGYELN
ncbi:MAG: hypothetical protein ACI4V7_10600 [Succinivibrionaceae bacterium]